MNIKDQGKRGKGENYGEGEWFYVRMLQSMPSIDAIIIITLTTLLLYMIEPNIKRVLSMNAPIFLYYCYSIPIPNKMPDTFFFFQLPFNYLSNTWPISPITFSTSPPPTFSLMPISTPLPPFFLSFNPFCLVFGFCWQICSS